MSLSTQRNALRKSSISIDTIRKSVTGLSAGLVNIGKQSRSLLKQTRENNLFKSNLIRKDGEFFRKRRENILRKQREDELESASVTGVAKKQGNLIQRSTRGFLGRMIDFIGVLILGWALTNLPMIIAKFQALFKLISKVVGILTGFLSGVSNFLVGIGTGISNFLGSFSRFEFGENNSKIREKVDEANNGLVLLNKDFLESVSAFQNDKNIREAGARADEMSDSPVRDQDENNQSIEEEFNVIPVSDLSVEEQENMGLIDNNMEIPEGVEAAAFTPVTQEDIDREILLEEELEAEEDEDMDIDNIEGLPNEQTPSSVVPDEPSGAPPQPSTASPSSSSMDMELEPEEGYANIEGMFDPVGTTNKLIKPIRKNIKNLKGRKKPKSTVMIVEKQVGSMSPVSASEDGKSKMLMSVGQNSQQTLLDLHRLNLKQN
tara:strand:+ start:949 stop:2247 length:1299 start_codon:yes stop_codon:yes gene_type:complete